MFFYDGTFCIAFLPCRIYTIYILLLNKKWHRKDLSKLNLRIIRWDIIFFLVSIMGNFTLNSDWLSNQEAI